MSPEPTQSPRSPARSPSCAPAEPGGPRAPAPPAIRSSAFPPVAFRAPLRVCHTILGRSPERCPTRGNRAGSAGLPRRAEPVADCRRDDRSRLLQVAANLDVEFADLLAESVAVEAEELGGFELVAAGGPQAQQDQRPLDLAQHPVIEPSRRQTALMRGKIVLEVAL